MEESMCGIDDVLPHSALEIMIKKMQESHLDQEPYEAPIGVLPTQFLHLSQVFQAAPSNVDQP